MAGVPAQLHDTLLSRYVVPEGVALKYWRGESTAVARLARAGPTYLIEADALAVIDAAASRLQGMSLRGIAHALGGGSTADLELEASLQCIIDGLIQSGLLRRVDDEAHSGPNRP